MIVIIASMGRCGSTALYDAVLAALPSFSGIFVRDLYGAQLKDGIVVKTHDFAPEVIPDNWRVIYAYGNVEDIMASVNMQPDEWKQVHAYNMHTESISDLRLEENYSSWRKHENVLFIHYDEIFESSGIIANFLKPNIQLPPRTQRKSKDADNNGQ